MSTKFYDLCGQEIKSKDFIHYYNKSYFNNTEAISYITDKGRTRKVGQNSCHVESVIEEILSREPKSFTVDDIALILAWKIGKIKHSESQEKIIFHSDWASVLGEYSEENKKFTGMRDRETLNRYGTKRPVLKIKKLAEFFNEHAEKINTAERKEILELVQDDINRNSKTWEGIGAVYLLTLLYFATNTRQKDANSIKDVIIPIYDRFAMRALKAIKEGIKPGNIVQTGIKLPDKSNMNFAEKLENIMQKYIGLIEEIFGIKKYSENRDIDRALWVYGHLFKESDAKNSGC